MKHPAVHKTRLPTSEHEIHKYTVALQTPIHLHSMRNVQAAIDTYERRKEVVIWLACFMCCLCIAEVQINIV